MAENKTSVDYGEASINVLNLLTYGLLVVGIIGSIPIFYSMGVWIGIASLFSTLIFSAFFFVIVGIANNIVAIRKNTHK